MWKLEAAAKRPLLCAFEFTSCGPRLPLQLFPEAPRQPSVHLEVALRQRLNRKRIPLIGGNTNLSTHSRSMAKCQKPVLIKQEEGTEEEPEPPTRFAGGAAALSPSTPDPAADIATPAADIATPAAHIATPAADISIPAPAGPALTQQQQVLIHPTSPLPLHQPRATPLPYQAQACSDEADHLREIGHFAAAVVQLENAITRGHLPSRAELAWILLVGRDGVTVNVKRAFVLVQEGTRLGCHHCQGVMSRCYYGGLGCKESEKLSFQLARSSSAKGSKFGQYMLGLLHDNGAGGAALDCAKSMAFYRLSAAQNLDAAKNNIGFFFGTGRGVAKHPAEALRWYKLAAAQGLPGAIFNVGRYYENGFSVPADRAEAIRQYQRAAAAGWQPASTSLQRLARDLAQ